MPILLLLDWLPNQLQGTFQLGNVGLLVELKYFATALPSPAVWKTESQPHAFFIIGIPDEFDICSKLPLLTKLHALGVGLHPPVLTGIRMYTYKYVILPLLVPFTGTYRNTCNPVVALLKFIVVDEVPLVPDKVAGAVVSCKHSNPVALTSLFRIVAPLIDMLVLALPTNV